jgi:ABC-2 type transport system ATP-binding protein
VVYLARLHGLDAASAAASMEHWTELLGIAERRSDEVLKLSLGNQQRVQLAAALVHSPEILVLDEPFSGLDPVAVDVMSAVLRAQAAAGVPVLFSSHQLELVEQLCDRVAIIKSGSLVAFGDIDDLRTTTTRRWVVDGPPHPQWLHTVRSAELVSAEGARTVVEVRDPSVTTVDQELLAAALAAGPVHEFARLRPSLTELYRHVVSAPEEAALLAVPQEVNA